MTGNGVRRVVTVSVALVLVTLIWLNRGRFIPLNVGSDAPDYTAWTLEGDSVRLSSYRGQVVLLNVWATWCKPCVREMPAMQRLHEQLGDSGLSVVAVSVDAPGAGVGTFGSPGSGDVRAFVQQYGLTFDVLHDPSGGIETLYQVQGLPTTFVIDRDGRIRRKILGAVDWDQPPHSDEIRSMLED